MGWQIAVAAATSIAGGLLQARSAREAGRDAMRAAEENAQILRGVTSENVALGLEAAGWNAEQIRLLGEYNAAAVEQARDMNTELMVMESLERMRQHLRMEGYTLGTMRAMTASSGISVNEGTPLHYLNDQNEEMMHSRRYTADVDRMSVLNYYTQESTRADLIRLEAEMKAENLLYNAEIEGEIAMNDADARAEQMINSGQAAMQAGRIQAYGAILGGIVGGISTYASYGGFTPSGQTSPSATGYGFNPYPRFGGTYSNGGYSSPIQYGGGWGYGR